MERKNLRRLLVLTMAACGLLVKVNMASADDFVWTGSGSWGNLGGWLDYSLPGPIYQAQQLPGPSDTVSLTSSINLDVTTNVLGVFVSAPMSIVDGGSLTIVDQEATLGYYNGMYDSSQVIQTGGTNSPAWLGVGFGSTGSYSLSNGTLSPNIENIGIGGGQGTFTQTGGTNSVVSNFSVGWNGGNGSFTISSGVLTSPNANIGDGYAGTGIGSFLQQGGSCTFNSITVYPKGTYTFQGGTLNAKAVQVGTGGTFNWTGGTLSIEGTGSNFGGKLTVPGSGVLEGSGTITDMVEVSSGGVISPGNPTHAIIDPPFPPAEPVFPWAPGILTTGTVTLDSSSTLVEHVIPMGGYDQLVVNGSITLDNPTLSFGFILTHFVGDLGDLVGNSYMLINNEGGDPIVGTFSGLPEGSLFQDGNYQMKISYTGGTGNDVVVTVMAVVPEPGSLAILASSVIGMLTRRRKSA
jgi:hypothetical protein